MASKRPVVRLPTGAVSGCRTETSGSREPNTGASTSESIQDSAHHGREQKDMGSKRSGWMAMAVPLAAAVMIGAVMLTSSILGAATTASGTPPPASEPTAEQDPATIEPEAVRAAEKRIWDGHREGRWQVRVTATLPDGTGLYVRVADPQSLELEREIEATAGVPVDLGFSEPAGLNRPAKLNP